MAALAVVYSHAANITFKNLPGVPVADWSDLGAAGVDVFFVISGFIISRAASGPTGFGPSLAFLRKRLIRVAPIYYLLSLPFVVWGIKVSGLDGGRLVASYLFWPATPGGVTQPYLGVGWTLCFEMLFYVCMAATLIGKRQVVVAVLLAGFAVAVATRDSGPAALAFVGNPIICEFLFGCLAGFLWQRGRVGALTAGLACLAIVVCWGSMFWDAKSWDAGTLERVTLADHTLDGTASWSRVGWFGVPSLVIVLAALLLEPRVSGLALLRRLSVLGDASYSIYLSHPLVFVVLQKAWRVAPPMPPTLCFVLSFAIALAAGLLTFRFVETPLLAAFRPRGRVGDPARLLPAGS